MSEIVQEGAEKLARMAAQIASFFAAYPEVQASEAIAEHINKFWGRQMRAEFLAEFAPGDARLHPLVAAALPKIRPPKSV